MTDKGLWTFYKRGMRQAAGAHLICKVCGKRDKTGLIDGMCTHCFCKKLDNDSKHDPTPQFVVYDVDLPPPED